jgi:diaminopimelate epimerase
MCDRHRGIGADGLMALTTTGPSTAAMRLFNADGSYSELSGNGFAALRPGWRTWRTSARRDRVNRDGCRPEAAGAAQADGTRYQFRAAMGRPEQLRQERLTVAEEVVTAVVLRVGNPQCVVLGPITDARLHRIGRPLPSIHSFPKANVELRTESSAPDRVRILIWERGVGPTEASGTGACAAAVAAAAYGGADRRLDVISPGGTQRVEWTDEGIWLTGWAELIATGEWL